MNREKALKIAEDLVDNWAPYLGQLSPSELWGIMGIIVGTLYEKEAMTEEEAQGIVDVVRGVTKRKQHETSQYN